MAFGLGNGVRQACRFGQWCNKLLGPLLAGFQGHAGEACARHDEGILLSG